MLQIDAKNYIEKLRKQPKAKQATQAEKAKKEADKQKQDRINSILSMQADDSLIQEKEKKGPVEISIMQEKSAVKKQLKKNIKPN